MPDYQQHERFGVHYLRPTSPSRIGVVYLKVQKSKYSPMRSPHITTNELVNPAWDAPLSLVVYIGSLNFPIWLCMNGRVTEAPNCERLNFTQP